jgi:dTDP-D-glucose 4,6-dehydratase
VVNILTKKAVLEEPMIINGKEQWRPLLHVKDAAEAISFGIENNIRGLYNLSYKNFRINDISKEISKLIPSSKIKYMDIPEEDMRNYRIISDKFRNLGWKPKYTIKDGILDLKHIFKKEGLYEIFLDFNINNKTYVPEDFLIEVKEPKQNFMFNVIFLIVGIIVGMIIMKLIKNNKIK